MIRRLIEPEEVALIIGISDDVEERYSCTRGEWVQMLVSICSDPRIFIIGAFDLDNNMVGYAFCQSYVSPPISNGVHIIYAYSPDNEEDNELAMLEIKNWAKELGANKISATTKNSEVLLGKYGFKESEFKILEIDL